MTGAATPLRTRARVVENGPEGGSSHRLTLSVPGWPGFEPGQFVMLSPGALGRVPRTDPLLPRPMAVYRVRGGDADANVEVLYKVTGRGTGLLAEAVAGDRIGLVGPLGRAFPNPEPGESAVLVGGGTGIASLYELAVRLAPQTGVTVLLGAQTRADLMGREDFDALDVALRVATDDGSDGSQGLVTNLLDEAVGSDPARIYACGPTPMMRAVADWAAANGRPCVASLENHMACGFGVCLGCAAPLAGGGFALVCRDGPTFDATSVAWEAMP